jgi:hypothetical protein
MKCLTLAEADMMRERASSPTRHPETHTHTHTVFFIYGLLQVATSGGATAGHTQNLGICYCDEVHVFGRNNPCFFKAKVSSIN